MEQGVQEGVLVSVMNAGTERKYERDRWTSSLLLTRPGWREKGRRHERDSHDVLFV